MEKVEFNELKYGKEAVLSKTVLSKVKIILAFIGSNHTILDVGCNDGTISKMIALNNNKVIGVDISRKAVLLAKEKGIEAYQCDMETQSLEQFEDNFFDVVYSSEVIEHIMDTDQFLQKIRRVLAPGGALIITTPNLASLGRRFLLLFGQSPHIDPVLRGDKGEHIRFFVKSTFLSLLQDNGFRIEYFTSDVVNFDNSHRFFSSAFAKLFPTLGRSLIVKAIKC